MTALEMFREMYVLFPAAFIAGCVVLSPLFALFMGDTRDTKETLQVLGKYVLLPIVVYALIGVVLFQDWDGEFARQRQFEEKVKVMQMKRQEIQAQKMYDSEAK